MYINVTETMFIEEFRSMGRMDNFSIDGLRALYEHLTDMEAELDQRIECDVIAICCDFNEMSWDEVREQYSDLFDEGLLARMDDEDAQESIKETLSDHTMVVYSDDQKVLFQVF